MRAERRPVGWHSIRFRLEESTLEAPPPPEPQVQTPAAPQPPIPPPPEPDNETQSPPTRRDTTESTSALSTAITWVIRVTCRHRRPPAAVRGRRRSHHGSQVPAPAPTPPRRRSDGTDPRCMGVGHRRPGRRRARHQPVGNRRRDRRRRRAAGRGRTSQSPSTGSTLGRRHLRVATTPRPAGRGCGQVPRRRRGVDGGRAHPVATNPVAAQSAIPAPGHTLTRHRLTFTPPGRRRSTRLGRHDSGEPGSTEVLSVASQRRSPWRQTRTPHRR